MKVQKSACLSSGRPGKGQWGRSVHKRRHLRDKYWGLLVGMYGWSCFYCRDDTAAVIDHVVPWSWDNDDDLNNLVPSCILCNAIASDKVFDDVESKRQYILSVRKNRAQRRAICVDCLLPYSYREHSPSLFLCAECYDLECKTKYAQTQKWGSWLELCESSGIVVEAHREFRSLGSKQKPSDRKGRMQKLLDIYNEVEKCAT